MYLRSTWLRSGIRQTDFFLCRSWGISLRSSASTFLRFVFVLLSLWLFSMPYHAPRALNTVMTLGFSSLSQLSVEIRVLSVFCLVGCIAGCIIWTSLLSIFRVFWDVVEMWAGWSTKIDVAFNLTSLPVPKSCKLSEFLTKSTALTYTVTLPRPCNLSNPHSSPHFRLAEAELSAQYALQPLIRTAIPEGPRTAPC